MTNAIEFRNVSKRYHLGLTRTSLPAAISKWTRRILGRQKDEDPGRNHIWAVRDASFTLSHGESMALIGPNGAGKSTILKLLANITSPTSGEIKINGRLSALIELGSGFHPDLTGRENIYLNGTILGLKHDEIDHRFDEIVDFSELEDFIDTPIKRYSSGMIVRLGFSVASCIEPDILLVDEVLAVGDASFRQKCINRIQTLIDSGTSIIFVSHNLWLVQSVCTKALYIDKGQIKHRGKTSEVIDVYDRSLNERRANNFRRNLEKGNEASADVEITRVDVINAEGADGTQTDLFNDQSAEIRAHYATYRDLGPVNFVVRVLRTDGVTCCMMRSGVDGFPVVLEEGSGVVSVTLDPLQLYGGTYYVQIIVRDESDASTMAVGWSDWFYVVGSVLSHQEMNGVFEPNRSWKQLESPGATLLAKGVGAGSLN